MNKCGFALSYILGIIVILGATIALISNNMSSARDTGPTLLAQKIIEQAKQISISCDTGLDPNLFNQTTRVINATFSSPVSISDLFCNDRELFGALPPLPGIIEEAVPAPRALGGNLFSSNPASNWAYVSNSEGRSISITLKPGLDDVYYEIFKPGKSIRNAFPLATIDNGCTRRLIIMLDISGGASIDSHHDDYNYGGC